MRPGFSHVARAPERLLVTDLDGTLIGAGDVTRSLVSWCRRRQVAIVYNTGRTWASARMLLRDLGLPWPDALVTGVGTEIRYRRGGPPDHAWQDWVSARWDRQAVEAVARTLGFELVRQPPIAQGRFKVSFEVLEPAIAAEFFARLQQARLWVHGMLTEDRWVDVIPFRAGKGAAAAHVTMRLGLSPENMLAAGDSENDIGLLSRSGPAVAVGNATRNLLGRLSPPVFRAHQPEAAGILEGMRHFGWLPG